MIKTIMFIILLLLFIFLLKKNNIEGFHNLLDPRYHTISLRNDKNLYSRFMDYFHYGNIRRDCSDEFYTHYAAVLGSKRQSELYQGTPIAYMWDDHDYVFHLLITIYCRKFD